MDWSSFKCVNCDKLSFVPQEEVRGGKTFKGVYLVVSYVLINI